MNDGLESGLLAEYEAIFAYSRAGAYLSGDLLDAVIEAENIHRDRRDIVQARLAANGVEIPSAQPSYETVESATDEDSAIAMVSELEPRTAQAWRSAVFSTTDGDREVSVEALADAAITSARWKRVLDETPSTVAYPGRTL